MISSPAFPPAYFLILGMLCGVVGFRIGWRARNRFILPFVQGLLGWVGFSYAWRGHGPAMAAATVVSWALATSIVSIYFFAGQPQATDLRIHHAKSYRDQMLERLRSAGTSRPHVASAMRIRLRQLFVHLVLATLTLNLAALVIGASRLNAMNASVATLLRAARRKSMVVLIGWPAWSVIRVIALAALGSAATAPLAARLGYPAPAGSIRLLVVVGVMSLALDLVLELVGLRRWESRLASAVDLEASAANRGYQAPFHLGLDQVGSADSDNAKNP